MSLVKRKGLKIMGNMSGFEAGKHEKGTALFVRQQGGEGLTEVSFPVEPGKELQRETAVMDRMTGAGATLENSPKHRKIYDLYILSGAGRKLHVTWFGST